MVYSLVWRNYLRRIGMSDVVVAAEAVAKKYREESFDFIGEYAH